MTKPLPTTADMIAQLQKGGIPALALSDPETLCTVHGFIPTGITVLDAMLGGGYPMGRIIEIYGDNSTGKSMLAALAVAEAQRKYKAIALFCDVETAISKDMIAQLGVDLDNLIYLAPDSIDEFRLAVEKTVKTKAELFGKDYPMVVAWDSVAATSTQAELDVVEKDGLEKKQYPAGAIQISAYLRAGAPRLFARNNVTAILVNQVRQKIGVMFGDDEDTYGGKAISFYTSVRLQLKNIETLKEGGQKVGRRVRITSSKNKIAPPLRTVVVPVYFGYGPDEAEACLDTLKDAEVITGGKSGWYGMTLGGEEQRFQRATWLDTLYDERVAEIRAAVYKLYGTVEQNDVQVS